MNMNMLMHNVNVSVLFDWIALHYIILFENIFEFSASQFLAACANSKMENILFKKHVFL